MRTGRTLGIAGVGLIGASIGLRAAAFGYEVHGWDPSSDHLACALERGAIAVAEPDVAALGRTCETLVIAAPLDATLALLAAYAVVPPCAGLVIDVASVKIPVARVGAALACFVATHPMAGSDRSGPSAASAELFVDRVWTYDANASGPLADRACAFIAEMGARPVAIASDEHDRVVALTSHLPQVLAVVLGARLGARQGDAYVDALCGSGMASMLRLGGSAWTVWRAILEANGSAVAQEVRGVADVLLAVAGDLEAQRSGALAELFAASAAAVVRLRANEALAEHVELAKPVSDER